MEKHRIEFVYIDLKVDVEKEIKKEADEVSNEIKIYMQDLLHSKLQPQKKSVVDQQVQTFWHDRFNILLDKMLTTATISKHEIMACLEIEQKDLSGATTRFKHWLKTRQEGAYLLKISQIGGIRHYTLLHQT